MEKSIVEEKGYSLKRGIDHQRELYKQAKHFGSLDVMCSCIENIKGEIKGKAIQKNKSTEIAYIEKIINWYRDIPSKYRVKTPNGYEVRLPSNINEVSLRNLHNAYEKLIIILETLELL